MSHTENGAMCNFTSRFMLALISLTACSTVELAADIITFDVRGQGGDFDFETQSGTFTDSSGGVANGLQISVSSFVNGIAGGVVNATGGSLGVNAAGSGDDTDQLDADLGLESLLFSFNDLPSITSITLTQVGILGFGGDDAGTLAIGASSEAIAAGTGSAIPAHLNLEGSSFLLAYTGTGNGFGITSLSFDITPAAVPEPASIAFLSLVVVGTGYCRLRRKRMRGPYDLEHEAPENSLHN